MSISLENYHQQRAQLIAEDTSLRADRQKLASLTVAEAKAEALLREIRKEEAERVGGYLKSLQVIDVPQVWHGNVDLVHAYPGMSFLTAKDTIESTRIFKIVKKVCVICN